MSGIVEELERRYADMVRRLEAGEIDEDTFEAEAERLQFQDEEGRIWALGARTGRWYVYTDQGWVLADPPREVAPPAEAGRERIPFSQYWLGLVLVLGATLACLLALGGGVAVWRLRQQAAPTVPAIVAATTPTPAPLRTSAPGLVWVTATPRPATETPTSSPTPPPTATPTPTETAAPSPTPSATWTAAPTATATRTSTPAPSPTPTSSPTARPTAMSTPSPSPTRRQATATATASPTLAAGAPSTPTPTRVPPTPTDTPTPQLAGRIVYPVYTEASAWYDIYIQPVDGGERQWIIGVASQPAISPDGQFLAYRSWQADDRGLRVMDLAGTEKRRVTDRLEDGLPAWAPDGSVLALSSRRENDRIDRIYTVSPHGGEARALSRDFQPVYGLDPAWLPDGRIVYKAIHGATGLYLMNPDGSNAQQLAADASATSPAVSPDGSAIAFMSQRDGNWEIYIIGADGSGLRRLTNDPAQDGLPAWSPDGGWIAFVSDRGGEWAIWAVQPDGSGLRELFPLQGLPGGLVRGEPTFSSRGWTEEQIQWLR
ncbi:MAG: PD40 domain-containing protein [Anaerolineae bacterium]|nr:PD40 domain-containing protein [Anaerolineae bacterium]